LKWAGESDSGKQLFMHCQYDGIGFGFGFDFAYTLLLLASNPNIKYCGKKNMEDAPDMGVDFQISINP